MNKIRIFWTTLLIMSPCPTSAKVHSAVPAVPVTAEDLEAEYNRLYEMGRHEQAAKLAKKACAIIRRRRGGNSTEYASCQVDLGTILGNLGEYDRAEELMTNALLTEEQALGKGSPEVATTLNQLGLLMARKGDFERAKSMLERSLAIRERVYGNVHPDVAGSLVNLAHIYSTRGDPYDLLLLKRSISIYRKTVSPTHPDLISAINNLTATLLRLGEFDEAEPLLQESLSLRKQTLGPEHPDVAVSLSNLAGLFAEQGEYGEAEHLYRQAISIWEGSVGPDHPLVASGVNNLATVLAHLGKIDEAASLFERALTIRESRLPPNHPDVATTLNNLANLHRGQRDYEAAETLIRKALRIREEALGAESPLVALTTNNLATILAQQKNYSEAISLHQRALSALTVSLGPEHPLVARGLNNLAFLYFVTGERSNGLELEKRSLDIEEKNLSEMLLFAEESRRLRYAATLGASTYYAIWLHLRAAPGHLPTAELALTTILRRKGRVEELSAESHATLLRALPDSQRHLAAELSGLRDEYANLTDEFDSDISTEELTSRRTDLRLEQEQLWQQIRRHASFPHVSNEPVTIEMIQEALPRDGVLVEFVEYYDSHEAAVEHGRDWADPQYAAYIVRPSTIDWVDLGPAKAIGNGVASFRRAIITRAAVPADLHGLIMAPVIERLGDASKVFIAPDGELNRVPFAALFDGERYLVERFDLYYLTTGRDLLRVRHTVPAEQGVALAVANPTGADLPGTELEADLIEALLPNVEKLVHDDATETRLRHLQRPWLVHLGTHGFYDGSRPEHDLQKIIIDEFRSPSIRGRISSARQIDNPMTKSGVLLASPDVAEAQVAGRDGRLTAYEVSGWDLRGTELVVLSACGTGLGAIESGEGVMGLRRAFAIAGAQTVVVSLWDLGDATAVELMDSYYSKLASGAGRAEAMQLAQLEFLGTDEHRHPSDWASFVPIGADGPLSGTPFDNGSPPPIESPRGCRVTVGVPSSLASNLILVFPLLLLVARRRARTRTQE